MTAENSGASAADFTSLRGFNEAAADDRGKPDGRAVGRRRAGRFNEAAADDRGKHPNELAPGSALPSFNEAAADDRGKPLGSMQRTALLP